MLNDFRGIYWSQAKQMQTLIRESKLPLAIQDNIFNDFPSIVQKYPVKFNYLNVPDNFKFIYDKDRICLDFTFVNDFLNTLDGVLSEESLLNLTKDMEEVVDFMFSHHVVNLFRQDNVQLLGRPANNQTLQYANDCLAIINRDLMCKYKYTLTHMFKSYLGYHEFFGFSRLYLPREFSLIEQRFKQGH